MRVNAEDNPATDSTSSSMDTANTKSDTIDSKVLLDNVAESMDMTSKPAPKIGMDLSYMMSWDPNARRTASAVANNKDGSVTKECLSGKVKTPTMETVEEGPSNGSAASLVTSTLHSSSRMPSDNRDNGYDACSDISSRTTA